MAVTLSVDQLTADTQKLYLRTVEDQVHDRIPFIYKLRRKRRVITKGGKKVVKPIRYAKNTQTQHYVKGQTLSSGTESKRTAAEFGWAFTQTPIKYDVEDEILNDGDNQIVDTIAEETKAAQEDQVDTLSQNFFGQYVTAGTVTDVDSIPAGSPLSINAAFYGADNAYGGHATYGGIARTAVGDWWDGNVDDCATINTATSVSYNQWDFMVDKCMQYKANRTDLMAVTGSALFRKWKSLVRAKEADIDISGMMAKAGFASFSIDGIELVLDDNVADDYLYMLDMSSWEWRISPKRNFEVKPFEWQGKTNNGIDEYLSRVMLAHQLVCWKPRVNYMATNMS